MCAGRALARRIWWLRVGRPIDIRCILASGPGSVQYSRMARTPPDRAGPNPENPKPLRLIN
jgi:hypothetical protein